MMGKCIVVLKLVTLGCQDSRSMEKYIYFPEKVHCMFQFVYMGFKKS